jgi:hypothetical protein
MIGGNLFSHKFNLKDPRDLDAAHRLIFNGGWIHSANGALPNGTNGYADTNCNPFSVGLGISDIHISYYSKSLIIPSDNKVIMGTAAIGTPNNTSLLISGSSGTITYIEVNGYNFNAHPLTTTLGLITGNRIINSSYSYFVNNSKTTISQSTNSINNSTILLGANRGTLPVIAQQFSNFQCAFSTIGFGLTDTEQNNFYNAIQAFQTSLGRQV